MLQEGKAFCSNLEQKESKHKEKDREEIPEPGPPARPPINQRLIGKGYTERYKFSLNFLIIIS